MAELHRQESEARGKIQGVTERRPNDDYPTPPELCDWVVDTLSRDGWIEWETFGPPLYVLEPSAGSGNFVQAVRTGISPAVIYAVDIQNAPKDLIPRGANYAVERDFLKPTKLIDENRYDLAIGNPPFALVPEGKKRGVMVADKHAERALGLLARGGVLAFVLKMSFYAAKKKRRKFLEEHPPACIYDLQPRPSFTGGGTDATEYGLFIWRKGWIGETIIRHGIWREDPSNSGGGAPETEEAAGSKEQGAKEEAPG